MPRIASPSSLDRKRSAAAARWQRRASPLSRYALLAYAAIVVDASLYPFSDWRDLGLAPFDYWSADWPRHALPFDLLVNALGYLPLGFFSVLALHPKVRGVAAVVVATLFALALSSGLEAAQTYLPARVASKVDVASNAAGALAGALVAARAAHALLDTGRLRMWRTRWFASDASRGLVLALVWFGALVYPDAFVFGTGGLVKVLDPELADRVAALIGLANPNDAAATAHRFQVAETVVTAATLVGIGLVVLGLMRPAAGWGPRLGALGLFGATTLAVKTLAVAFLFDQLVPWPWLTEGARAGVGIAAAALVVLAPLPARMRWALAIAALAAALALVNLYPDNPYANPIDAMWTRGKLMNFYGLASGVNLVWPFLALAYLLRHRGRAPERPPGRPRGPGTGRSRRYNATPRTPSPPHRFPSTIDPE